MKTKCLLGMALTFSLLSSAISFAGEELEQKAQERAQSDFRVARDLKSLQKAIADGADPYETTGGSSRLHTATYSNEADILEYLIELGLPVDAEVDTDYQTPLHIAVKHGRMACAKILLAAKADVKARGYYGYTPLHRLAMSDYDSPEIGKMLLEAKANIDDCENTSKGTAILLAAMNRNFELYELLKTERADKKLRNILGDKVEDFLPEDFGSSGSGTKIGIKIYNL